jgi:hypothetical protein
MTRMKKHEVDCENNKVNKCKVCGFNYRTKAELTVHFNDKHNADDDDEQ